MHFHYFDIEYPAREDFIVDLGTMARDHVLFDLTNRLYKKYHITVKARK